MWLTHFEDYEDELVGKFCPSPQPSVSPTPTLVGEEVPSDPESPPLDVSPPMRSVEFDPFGFDAEPDCVLLETGSVAQMGFWTRDTAFGWQTPYLGYHTLQDMRVNEVAKLETIAVLPRGLGLPGEAAEIWPHVAVPQYEAGQRWGY